MLAEPQTRMASTKTGLPLRRSGCSGQRLVHHVVWGQRYFLVVTWRCGRSQCVNTSMLSLSGSGSSLLTASHCPYVLLLRKVFWKVKFFCATILTRLLCLVFKWASRRVADAEDRHGVWTCSCADASRPLRCDIRSTSPPQGAVKCIVKRKAFTLKAFLKERVWLGKRRTRPGRAVWATGSSCTERDVAAWRAESREESESCSEAADKGGGTRRGGARSGTGAGPWGRRLSSTEWRRRPLEGSRLSRTRRHLLAGWLLSGDCRNDPWRGIQGSGATQNQTRCTASAGPAANSTSPLPSTLPLAAA